MNFKINPTGISRDSICTLGLNTCEGDCDCLRYIGVGLVQYCWIHLNIGPVQTSNLLDDSVLRSCGLVKRQTVWEILLAKTSWQSDEKWL